MEGRAWLPYYSPKGSVFSTCLACMVCIWWGKEGKKKKKKRTILIGLTVSLQRKNDWSQNYCLYSECPGTSCTPSKHAGGPFTSQQSLCLFVFWRLGLVDKHLLTTGLPCAYSWPPLATNQQPRYIHYQIAAHHTMFVNYLQLILPGQPQPNLQPLPHIRPAHVWFVYSLATQGVLDTTLFPRPWVLGGELASPQTS